MPSVNARRAFGAFLFISSLSAASSGVARADPPAPVSSAARPVTPTPAPAIVISPAPADAKRAAQPSIAAPHNAPAPPAVEVGLPAPTPRSPERPALDRKADTRRWLIVGGASATALGVVMGTAFAILSENKRAERDRQIDATRGCQGLACEPYNAPERARGGFLTGALVSFIAAGALGAGTLTYSLVTRPKRSRVGAASATVSIGPGGAAARVGISW